MVASSKVDPTLCNRYPNQEKEYIFCVKGRPFGCLVSPNLPTPTSSLIDYNLVKDLGLNMSDLQYSKFFFAGNKMRILGKVTMTVQTIHEGIASGNLPFKANVVLNLFKCLDIDTVAGVKLRKRLSGEESELDCTSSGAPSMCSSIAPTPASSPSRSPPPSPTPSTPPRSTSPSPPTKPRFPLSSPPGFPKQPQHIGLNIIKRPEIKVSLTAFPNAKALSSNLHALTETIHNADLMPKPKMELRALHESDPGGKVQLGDNGGLSFVTMNGLTYVRGHGRNNKCSPYCQDVPPDQIPHNCGYHRQWLIPYNFKPCSESCEGAFCECLNYY